MDEVTADRIASALEGIEVALVALVGKTATEMARDELVRTELAEARRVVHVRRDSNR